MDHYHAVILCGGSGTRLWPLTRQALPKQFLALGTERPLLVETYSRLRRTLPPERIWVVTGRAHEALVREMLTELPGENVLAEPLARNTSGAIGLAMARLLRRDPDAVFTALPSDHLMTNLDQFDAALALAAENAVDAVTVCIGVTPRHPETGYGYIERGEVIASRGGVVAYRVERFVEKPDAERAAEYVRAGTFLWNAGMFTWRAAGLRELLERHQPGAVEAFERAESRLKSDPDAAAEAFAALPNVSIDYVIAERAAERVAIEADLGWIDIGGWEALYAVSKPKDAEGNVTQGEVVAVDSRGTYVSTARADRLAAVIGVEDLIVVDTDDALLVCRRDRAQDVRRVVEELRRRGLERHL